MEILSKQENRSSNSLMVSQPGQSLLPISLQNAWGSFTSEEKELLQVKYAAPRFGAIADLNAVCDHVSALIFKIHVVTGWEVPASDAYLITLQDQLRKKLLEDHRDLNPDEIEYAFRKYATRVKNWGKAMNLGLVDEVLSHYKAHRSEISEVESQKAERAMLPGAPPEVNFDEYSALVYENFKAGALNDFRLIPHSLYEYYSQAGEINATKQEKHAAMERAAQAIKQMKAEDASFANAVQTEISFKNYQIRFAQKLIVADYFKLKMKADAEANKGDSNPLYDEAGLQLDQAGQQPG